MGHSHSESNCNLHNTWLHISPSLKGTSLQRKYLPITPPDDLLLSSIYIYSAKPRLVSCSFLPFQAWTGTAFEIQLPVHNYSKDSFWEVCSHFMICSIFLLTYFSNSSCFHWNSLTFGTDLLGILLIAFHFFQFSAGIFPLRLNDFESTNFLEIYLSIFVLTRLPISEPVKAFQIFQKSDETQWNYVWHPGASHVRT